MTFGIVQIGGHRRALDHHTLGDEARQHLGDRFSQLAIDSEGDFEPIPAFYLSFWSFAALTGQGLFEPVQEAAFGGMDFTAQALGQVFE